MEDKTELEEQIVLTPERISNALINQAKWKRILADPQVKEGAKAVGRTLVNTGIAAGELVPFLGEVGSWGADLAKIATHLAKRYGVELHLDLTPDVPKGSLII
ncbi:hypothetical protein A3A75_01980 [Candidatus Woesebacteria bacterium RIFCSPLOWO2_01_FULL_39_10]|uniref:Uncharacterized protein n=1 Tax=Candidatus Woesebacteria bacterium RIFCSPLOWO2_01_FULL_39_10 TaxID=1802516 RepID=A0A1F8BCC1_9BACT|nr:MAG: hypothetical protein A3A75_01980 [Candidatus Woesebacteria bacterium RIFCSPLOWO2_01_FULL_39_10]